MANPYAPSNVDQGRPEKWSAKRLHAFAGGWLIVGGVLHFLAMNLLSHSISFDTAEFSPLLLSGLGLLVVAQFRVAIALTRIIGSFTIIGLVFAVVLLIAGFGDGGELTYGTTTVSDPKPWQLLLFLMVIVVTIIPPWWMLQRALARKYVVHRSSDDMLSDG